MTERCWACRKKLIPIDQAAYTTNLSHLHRDASRKTKASHYEMFILMLDMLKAFDSIDHKKT